MLRAIGWRERGDAGAVSAGEVTLDHDGRHLRRRRLKLDDGGEILVDLADAVALPDGGALVLEDGSQVAVRAAVEALYAITARDDLHLLELAWHLGNRHLPCEIRTDHILIARDHVIRAMVEGLGGTVCEVEAPFSPVHGAYHAQASHGHDHGHGDHHGHDHHQDAGHAHGDHNHG